MSRQKQPSLLTKVYSILKLRCPRCMEGEIFKSTWEIHPACPQCQLVYEREPGYFTGAMYLSYGMAVLAGLPIWGLMLYWQWPNLWSIVTLGFLLIAVSPLLFRYSRVIWMYIDQAISPR